MPFSTFPFREEDDEVDTACNFAAENAINLFLACALSNTFVTEEDEDEDFVEAGPCTAFGEEEVTTTSGVSPGALSLVAVLLTSSHWPGEVINSSSAAA